MKFRRDAGKISVKAFRDIDRSPCRRDILKRTEELSVTSVGRPALLLRFVDRYCLNFVRQRKMLQEFRLWNSRFELQWQTGGEVRRRRNSGSRESLRFRRRNNAARFWHGKLRCTEVSRPQWQAALWQFVAAHPVLRQTGRPHTGEQAVRYPRRAPGAATAFIQPESRINAS